MGLVLLTAIGVGGATAIGAIIGFIFKNFSHRFADIVLAFASGVMLAAAVVGLILPSIDIDNKFSVFITVLGIFVGAVVLGLIDKIIPHEHTLLTAEDNENHTRLSRVILFVTAIAIHNFPEGIAAGVSFGTGNDMQALIIAGGIALQNIPEGMVIIGPMLSAGVKPKKTLFLALLTGLVEVVGTLVGYFASSISAVVLPFALAFAGGTMLYVISHEMIPETHSHGSEKAATFSLMIGFCIMLITDTFFG